MTRTMAPGSGAQAPERVALVGLTPGGSRRLAAEESLDELANLVEAVGAGAVYRLLQERSRPDPATFLGSGKLSTLRAACDELDIGLVVFDNELSPAQLRNLERAVDRRVVDRTQLILDIFARRARTREGQLQVELAQLKYLLPRLVGARAALSRLGGGIGTRGPGETKLETDRRKIRQRIASLAGALSHVQRRRGQLRDRRKRGDVPTVAIVGYTNAGKTTLFNRLAREHAVTSDALFVTLDPLVRQVRLDARQSLLLSDTVGFIDRLPHTLVAAFRATLEEVVESDLLLHVVDASSPDVERRMRAVRQVLEEVGALEVPALVAFNKCDRLVDADRARLTAGHPGSLAISALTGDGLEALRETLSARLALDTERITVELDASQPATRERIAWFYRVSHVLSHQARGDKVKMEVAVPRRWLDRIPAIAEQP